MSRIVRTLCAALVVAALGTGSRAGAAEATAQIVPGDYGLDGSGTYRHIVVTSKKTISYEVWRVTPSNKIKYRLYLLFAPAAPPTESDSYKMTLNGKPCGNAGLDFYRTGTEVHPEIIIMSYGDNRAAFGGPSPNKSVVSAPGGSFKDNLRGRSFEDV